MDIHVNKASSKFSYRIEEKPGGGFLARSDDPTMEAVEGETREEVINKLEGLFLVKAGLPAGISAGVTKLLGGVNFDLKIAKNMTVRRRNEGKALSADEQKMLTELAGPQLQTPSLQTQPTTDFQRELAKSSSDSTGTILRIIAALIALGAIVYAIVVRH